MRLCEVVDKLLWGEGSKRKDQGHIANVVNSSPKSLVLSHEPSSHRAG